MEKKEYTQYEAKFMRWKIEDLKEQVEFLKGCLLDYVLKYEKEKEIETDNLNAYKEELNALRNKNEELKEKLASCDTGYEGYEENFNNEYLTYKEWKYLKGVIDPFRDKVIDIIKKSNGEKGEYLIIRTCTNSVLDIYLPCFEEGKYYKSMEINEEYTLKELGL